MPDSDFQAYTVCRLWDIHDEGIEDVLDRLRGEAGVNGVVVPVYAGMNTIFRVHPTVSPRSMHLNGGCHFHPQAAAYGATRLKPVIEKHFKSRDPLPKVAEACDRFGLHLRLSMTDVLEVTSSMPKAYESCRQKDVFGETVPTRLCPVHPDVRMLLQSIAQDVTEQFKPMDLSVDYPAFLEDVGAAGIHFPGEFLHIGCWLTSLCFCESCHRAARCDGIDIESTARVVRVMLDEFFTTGHVPCDEPQDNTAEEIMRCILDFFQAHPILADFRDWRCGQMASLIDGIRNSCTCGLALALPSLHPILAADVRAAAPAVDAVQVRINNDPDRVIPAVANLCGKPASALTATIWTESGCYAEELQPEFVRVVAETVRLGVRSVTLLEYGSTPLGRLGWVHQAIRYARREAG